MEYPLNHLSCQAWIVKPLGIMIEEAESGNPALSMPLFLMAYMSYLPTGKVPAGPASYLHYPKI